MSVLDRIIDPELTIKERWLMSLYDDDIDPADEEEIASRIAGLPLYWFGTIPGFLNPDSVLGDQRGRLYVLEASTLLYRIDRRLILGEKWVLIGEMDD